MPISGAVLVTTPQDVALSDVTKALAMFQRMSVPVLGLVENMTAFVCPHCGELTEIFGRGGGERFAAQHGLEYLGGVPLDITVRQGGDVGVPAVAQREPGPAARALTAVAQTVAARMSVRAASRRRPGRCSRSPEQPGPADALSACGSQGAADARFCDRCGTAFHAARRPPATDRDAERPAVHGSTRPRTIGDRRIVTALFADLVDYVRMLAEHDPEVVRARVTSGPRDHGRGHRAVRRHAREIHRRCRVRGLRLAAWPMTTTPSARPSRPSRSATACR